MSLKFKIIIPLIVVTLLVMITLGFTYYFVNNQINEINSAVSRLDEIDKDIIGIKSDIQSGILTEDVAYMIQVANNSKVLYQELSLLEDEYESAEGLVSVYEDYYKTLIFVSSLFMEGRYEEATVQLGLIENSYAEISNSLAATEALLNSSYQQAVTMLNTFIMLSGVVLVVFIIFMAFVIVPGFILSSVRKVNEVVEQVAKGDFTVEVDVISGDELGQMAENLNETIKILSSTLLRVQDASHNVSHASEEIAAGNQDLSQRTEEQASSLEEIAATIEEISSSLDTSSANASEADNLSRSTLASVEQGKAVVIEMQSAMEEITKGSKEISEIIVKVNDIAFQTNLLALNAAVEAARAGEQGRGFAVVAAEVRNLAGRASESAKEIERLIRDSIDRVDKGNMYMEDTRRVLEEIVEKNQKASEVVGEIATMLKEQTISASDIRTAVEELNQVTQQNASLVEEIASSSENMNDEASELSDQVGYFKINHES